MLKKLLLIFITVTITVLSTKNISAKESLKKLVICGNNPSLDLDGYKLIETNINYEQEGLYHAVYEDNNTKVKNIRQIEVISEQTLSKGISTIKQQKMVSYKDYIIKKTITTPYGTASIGIKNEKCYYLLEKNNELKTYILGNSDSMEIRELIYDSDSTYVFGYGYTMINNHPNIYLVSFNEQGICILRKSIGGSSADQALDMILYQDSIILSGKTTSSDGPFTHVANKEDSFLLQLNKYTGTIENYLNIGLDGNDYIDQIIYLDNFYLVQFYYSYNVPCCKIIVVNKNFEVIKENYLSESSLMTSKGISTINNKIYLLLDVYKAEYNRMISCLYEIDQELNISLIDQYNSKDTITYNISANYGIIRIIYHNYKTKQTFLRIIEDQFIKEENLMDIAIDKAYLDDDHIYISTPHETYIYSFEHLVIKNLDKIYPNLYDKNQIVSYNKQKSIDFVNENIYGNYDILLYYELKDFDLQYIKQITIENQVNIADNNKYHKGLKLKFNARAYLNNELINQEHIINQPGTYTLELIGHQNIKTIYKFEVFDLDEEINITTSPNYQFAKEQPISNDSLSINQNLTTNNLITNDYTQDIWYIIIPLITFITFLILYVTVIRRKI